jgi:probable F420-dependent oxidoreductase
MKLGITPPLFTMTPDAPAGWEPDAELADVVPIIEAADRLGYEFVTCSEHVVIPTDVAPVRGGRYWDPLATFGYLSARTERIRFATYVLVLGYHHPLEIAKRYGTLDRISNGRLILGVGVGSLQPEFELLGAAFDDRGARGDDALRALRTSFGRRQPEYHGEFYDYEDMLVDPCGVQTTVPLWIGGRTARSLRRAVELADGWAPFGLSVADEAAMLEQARATDAWVRRVAATDLPPFEVVLPSPRRLSPVEEPAAAADALAALADVGATMVNVAFRHRSPEHYVEQLAAMAEVAAAVPGAR